MSDAILKELREFGLTYPGAHSKSPWPDHDDRFALIRHCEERGDAAIQPLRPRPHWIASLRSQ